MSIAITAARNSSGELRHNSATTSLDDNKQEREVCERTNSEAKGLHATTHPLVTDTCAALAAPSNGYLSIKTYENPAYHSRSLSLSFVLCLSYTNRFSRVLPRNTTYNKPRVEKRTTTTTLRTWFERPNSFAIFGINFESHFSRKGTCIDSRSEYVAKEQQNKQQAI